MKQYGFLAIWCDMAAEDLDDYRAWLMQEHMADRTGLPGFLSARLFEGLDVPTSHFILYATEGPEVLESAPYLAVLDAPSDWTRRIMPRFGPFDRAAGRQLWKMGNGTGPCLAVARITPDGGDPDPQAVQRALAHLIDLPGIAGMRLMGVDRAATDIATEEKTMRPGGEGAFRHLLVVEAVSDTAIRGAVPAIEDAAVAAFGPRAAVDLSTRRLVYAEAPHEGPAAR